MLSDNVCMPRTPSDQQSSATEYGSRFGTQSAPKREMAEQSMSADVAYQIVHDELNLDGNPALNLASFVTTWMEPQAEKLMAETLNKNYIDQFEYPQTALIQQRCVNMLANLFHAPKNDPAVGTGTVGSSEAIHLAGLALKWKWRNWRRTQGKSTDRPNLVMSHSAHVCCEKFARYFDVEPRYVPLTTKRYVLGVEEALELVDENTIGVVAILGNTYTGQYDPIRELNDALVELNQRNGWDVPIHVDAASGGFVAPFTTPDLMWDFRLPLVKSINVSGHKYGLVHPGVGWAIWRSRSELPEDLIFHVDYLGEDQPTFTLNFSRGANQIIAQYYNFLRLGQAGYKRVMLSLQSTARHITEQLNATGKFSILSRLGELPVVTLSLKDSSRFTVFDLSEKLRQRGWIVPAYRMAPDAEEISVLRVVVREGLSRNMADMLLEDILRAVDCLEKPSRFERPAMPTREVCSVC